MNLPYIPRLSEKIKRIAAKSNIRTLFNSNNTLRSQLVRFKPKSDNVLNKYVIYSIPCECSKSYTGETGRAFDVRLKEHKNSIKKKDPDVSKLCEHHYYIGHHILWDQAEIIGHGQRWKARKFHEAAEIMKSGELVFSEPCMEINPIWRPMIKKLNIRKNKKVYATRRSQRLKETETLRQCPQTRKLVSVV
jgi:hypothetical protein